MPGQLSLPILNIKAQALSMHSHYVLLDKYQEVLPGRRRAALIQKPNNIGGARKGPWGMNMGVICKSENICGFNSPYSYISMR